ncbi:Inner membrane protein YhaH [Aurantimicrobium photophilum]|uniref:Inner membrane protein YhaH n=2 Tax=Aurantimicrobium photophilum TaxID=1987356 RepID=A0A2Z3RY35_9MICO|nr:Inner membrane protein YhaH [Aurantimicrobium photophilum]
MEIMNFSQAIQSVFSKATKLEGRAPRSEYWYWVLFTFIVQMFTILPVILVAMLIPQRDVWAILPFLIAAGSIWVFLWITRITVTVRRYHDQGMSGWMFFIGFIPAVGGLLEIIFMLQPSQPGSNKFGVQYLGK